MPMQTSAGFNVTALKVTELDLLICVCSVGVLWSLFSANITLMILPAPTGHQIRQSSSFVEWFTCNILIPIYFM